MKLRTVIAKIEEEISIRQAEDFDNVGLLCGVPDRDVSGILYAMMHWKMLWKKLLKKL
jgi:putative NIF3 family GTP cyclohydrolase 1 type 2